MSHSELDTRLRFRISSLLALTTALAIVFAIAGPYLAELSREKQGQLVFLIILLALSIPLSIANTIWRRRRIGRVCGALLLALPLQTSRNRTFTRLFYLLVLLPLILALVVVIAISLSSITLFISSVLMVLMVLQLGSVGKLGILLWSEGFGNYIELCENGVVVTDRYYEWTSPNIESLSVRKLNNDLVFKAKGGFAIVRVPKEQQELVRAILNRHYQRPKPISPLTTDQT